MWWWLVPSLFLCLAYCALILQYRRWFVRLPLFSPQPAGGATFFSVIIPARNEEENIGSCLQSIFQNHYPHSAYEVLVIDDHSTDGTAAIVKQWQSEHANLRLLPLAELLNGEVNSYKKKAIELAVGLSAGDWIVTTDADCVVPQGWLQNFHQYIAEQQPVFVAAPVSFISHHTGVSRFQSLDFMSLQGITAASVSAGFHSMCNGANLAYEKKAFHAVNGFRGIDNIASGDDMLLMHKINKRFPGRTGYLFHPHAVVQTQPVDSWRAFLNQRIRWASKANRYDDKRIFYVLVLVYFCNVALLVLPFGAFFFPPLLLYWLLLLAAKTATELYFLLPVARFFTQQRLLWWFPLMQPIHIVYTVVAGWLGRWGTYEWKGRQVK